MKISRLKDHTIIPIVAEVSKNIIVEFGRSGVDTNIRPTSKEQYTIETLISLSHVVSCMDQLHFCVGMLAGYKTACVPPKMNRHDYILFGMENYYLRLTSVYDRCLRLANIVFQLGLPEKECRESTVTKNLNVRETSVARTLKELDKFTNQFQQHRNKIAHSSAYSEQKLSDLEIYYIVKENDKEVEKYEHWYKHEADMYVKEKKSQFQLDIEKFEGLVEKNFDALQKIFVQRLNKM